MPGRKETICWGIMFIVIGYLLIKTPIGWGIAHGFGLTVIAMGIAAIIFALTHKEV